MWDLKAGGNYGITHYPPSFPVVPITVGTNHSASSHCKYLDELNVTRKTAKTFLYFPLWVKCLDSSPPRNKTWSKGQSAGYRNKEIGKIHPQKCRMGTYVHVCCNLYWGQNVPREFRPFVPSLRSAETAKAAHKQTRVWVAIVLIRRQ